MFYSFCSAEYDPDQRWLVISTVRDPVELPDGADFYVWADEGWPNPSVEVKLDPGSVAFGSRGCPDQE